LKKKNQNKNKKPLLFISQGPGRPLRARPRALGLFNGTLTTQALLLLRVTDCHTTCDPSCLSDFS